MENDITKLNSEELLEVSGGMEKEPKKFWARETSPIDPESGKQEINVFENKDSSENENIEINSEEG